MWTWHLSPLKYIEAQNRWWQRSHFQFTSRHNIKANQIHIILYIHRLCEWIKYPLQIHFPLKHTFNDFIFLFFGLFLLNSYLCFALFKFKHNNNTEASRCQERKFKKFELLNRCIIIETFHRSNFSFTYSSFDLFYVFFIRNYRSKWNSNTIRRILDFQCYLKNYKIHLYIVIYNTFFTIKYNKYIKY